MPDLSRRLPEGFLRALLQQPPSNGPLSAGSRSALATEKRGVLIIKFDIDAVGKDCERFSAKKATVCCFF